MRYAFQAGHEGSIPFARSNPKPQVRRPIVHRCDGAAGHRAAVGPHTGHTSCGSRVPGLVSRAGLSLAGKSAECLGDHLIAVPSGVLVDHGRAGAGMTEAGHQFFDRRARRGGKRAARVSQVVKMKARYASVRTGRVPYGPEVGAAQRCAFRADKDEAPAARQSEAVKMPAKLGHEFGRATGLKS